MSNREVYWNLTYEDKKYRIVAADPATARIERQLSGIGYAEVECSRDKDGTIRLEVWAEDKDSPVVNRTVDKTLNLLRCYRADADVPDGEVRRVLEEIGVEPIG